MSRETVRVVRWAPWIPRFGLVLALFITCGLVAQATDLRCTLKAHCCCADHDPTDCCRVPTLGALSIPPPPPPALALLEVQPPVMEVLDWIPQPRVMEKNLPHARPSGLRAPPFA